MKSVWTDNERRAWNPPEKLKPSEWAEQFRYLPSNVAAEPGKYKNSRTPYIAGIIDALTEPYLEEIVILKAAQVGYTTSLQTLIGWAIDREPAPALLVMPSQDECRKVVQEQIVPLIDNTPQLQTHLLGGPWDITKEALIFDTMPVYLGWAGSPQSLARRACRYIFLDEVDKYPAWSGNDADPISLARARARTYLHRKRIVIGSTPTTRDGAVWKAWEGCGDRRYYHVPCPHCLEYQRLVFSQVRFGETTKSEDKVQRAEVIERSQSAYYECERCRQPIRDAQKIKMLLAGHWLSDGQTIDRDGRIHGERPKAKRVGFHLPALYSPWVSFSAIAAGFVRAQGDSAAMMEFRNQTLAEVHEEVAKSVRVDELRKELSGAPQPLVLPRWTGTLIASADVQKDEVYFVVRAWGFGYQSQLIHFGTAGNFDELKRVTLDTPYCLEPKGDEPEAMTPLILVVDSGYRTDEVYQFARTDGRIVPVKGSNTKPRQTISLSSAANGVDLRILDTDFFKDRLATLRQERKWTLNSGVTDEYLRHLSAEQKIRDRKSSQFVWRPVSEGAANHFFDAEIYNIAGAEIAQCALIPPVTILEQQRDAGRKLRETAKQHEKDAKQARIQAELLKQRQPDKWVSGPNRRWL